MTQQAVKNLAGESDANLLERFAASHDEAAFAEVVRRHGGMVLSVCRGVLGNSADAEDAAQAVFLTLARKSASTSVRTHLVGWLHRVAWYIAKRAATTRGTRARHEKESATMNPHTQREGEQATFDSEIIHAGLAKLPEKYRVPIILHHLEGYSHAETATLTGCSTEAVAVRLHRGREMLRKRINRRGVAAAVAVFLAMPVVSEASPLFVASTTKSAVAIAGGKTLAGSSMALSNAAINMLFWAKMKRAGIALGSVVLVASGILLWSTNSASADPASTSTSTSTSTRVPAAASAPKSAPASTSAPASAPGPMTYLTGRITLIDAASVSVLRQDGSTNSVALSAATKYTLDNKPAALADIRPGMDAAVVHVFGRAASEIRARTVPP